MNDAIDAADHANLAIYTIYFKGEQERQAGEGFPGGRRGGMERRLAGEVEVDIPVVVAAGYPGGGGG